MGSGIAAKDGLLALSVGVGLGALAEMMETEVEEVVGPKGKRNRDRAAVRHGHEDGEITLGGRRVGVQRPRARTADGEHIIRVSELALGPRSRPNERRTDDACPAHLDWDQRAVRPPGT
jgi:hypothetical protein